MKKNKRNSNNYPKFRKSFSFGNFERLSTENNIDNSSDEEENVNNKETIGVQESNNLKIPKKKGNLHARKSYSISVSTSEYKYWKKVAQMNKKNVSSLIRDIVNEHTGYEKTKE